MSLFAPSFDFPTAPSFPTLGPTILPVPGLDLPLPGLPLPPIKDLIDPNKTLPILPGLPKLPTVDDIIEAPQHIVDKVTEDLGKAGEGIADAFQGIFDKILENQQKAAESFGKSAASIISGPAGILAKTQGQALQNITGAFQASPLGAGILTGGVGLTTVALGLGSLLIVIIALRLLV